MNKMREIYLNNAATTRMDERVLEAMLPYMKEAYGNPASDCRLGNEARAAIAGVRRAIKDELGADKGDIFFTSGGTEANNWAIMGTVEAYKIRHIITSPIEHKSVLKCIDKLVTVYGIRCTYVKLSKEGDIDYDDLARLLKGSTKVLVSLMHGNNEIGNLTDIHRVGQLCQEHRAIFHTDMVQTVGHYPISLSTLPVDICTASAHKFHGPKGVGLIYVKKGIKLAPLLYGGLQEHGLRAGTQYVAGIVGLGKALKLAMQGYAKDSLYVKGLKIYMIEELRKKIPSTKFHGLCTHLHKSLYHILNIGITMQGIDTSTLLFKLQIEGISVSGGSACMSGASVRSHVLDAITIPEEHAVLRASLSKYNTKEEVDYTVERLSTIGK